MAVVFVFIRWPVSRVAQDVLSSCGKCILCCRRCGSGVQFLDVAVKLLRIVSKWHPQELFDGGEKNLGKAPRSLWVLLFRTNLADMYTLTCVLKEWSQDCLPETSSMSSLFFFVFSFFQVTQSAYKYLRRQCVQKKPSAQLNKAGISGLRLYVASSMRMYSGDHIYLDATKHIKNEYFLKFKTSLKIQDTCRADI